jgi:hypothetical protein
MLQTLVRATWNETAWNLLGLSIYGLSGPCWLLVSSERYGLRGLIFELTQSVTLQTPILSLSHSKFPLPSENTNSR